MKKIITILSLCISILFSGCIKNGDDTATQLSQEVTAIDNYLSSYAYYPLYFTSGMRMDMLYPGTGVPPHSGQNVTISYKARVFSSGVVFDSASSKTIKLDDITVNGVKSCLAFMREGSTAYLFIPSLYGYGSTGTTNVPANSTLLYEMTLNTVTKTSTEQTQFTADTAAIHQYLTSNNIDTAYQLSSGIWYTINASGTGSSPRAYSSVTIAYTGKLLSTGATFDSGTITSNIFSLIDGLKITLPTMRVGDKYTFFIPSGYAYGTTGSGSTIPANANIIFQAELKAVTTQ